MKHIAICIGLLTLIPPTSFAQRADRLPALGVKSIQSWALGILGGMQQTNWTGKDVMGNRPDRDVFSGVAARIPLKTSWSFETGLFFSHEGYRGSLRAERFYQHANYVQVPLALGWKPSARWQIMAGSQLGILASATEESAGSRIRVKERYHNLAISGIAGVAYQWHPRWELQARWMLGLTPLMPDTKAYSRALQLGLVFWMRPSVP